MKLKMKSKVTTFVPGNLDKAGIMCSGACALHCMLIPVVALTSPTIAAFFETEWIHIGLLVVLTPIAIIAFYRGLKIHQKAYPIYLGSVGFVFLLMAVASESVFKIEIENLEITITIIGCIFLISAHIFNIKYLRLVWPGQGESNGK